MNETMDRRNFLKGAVTTAVVGGVVVQEVRSDESRVPALVKQQGKTFDGLEIPPGLTELEAEMYREVHVEGHVCIPSRKMLRRTPKHADQLVALKSLTFKGLIYWDVAFESKEYVFMPRRNNG